MTSGVISTKCLVPRRHEALRDRGVTRRMTFDIVIAQCRADNSGVIDVGDDPRLERGLALFNTRDYAEAADEFEELFFEAVGDEVELVRALMQVSVGVHHIERGQPRAAIERLDEGLLAIARVTNARGVDFDRLAEDVRGLIAALRGGSKVVWPTVARR